MDTKMDNYNYSGLWHESYWFPEGKGYGWKDLVNVPGSQIYYPQIEDLNWTIVIGFILILARYLLETFLVVPIAIKLGVPDKKRRYVTSNPQLEVAYKQNKTITHSIVQTLSKQTDLTERQVEIWMRKRKTMDQPLPIQKFRECSYHLMFYTIFFVYGIAILWNKPYFWKTVKCWEGWPKQGTAILLISSLILSVKHVSSDLYWYYMLEMGFYWSLIFTLCTDVKRKDFKEMTIHHFATIILMYFSWVLNFVRVGTLVLAVHDAADTWLALAKMSIYIKNKTATDIFFGIFLVVWVVSRLFVYPYVVLHCTTIEPYTAGIMDKTFWAHWFFNFFLYLLQVLHFLWTYMIFRIVYRKLKKGNVEDVRSDSDDSGANSDDECEDEGIVKNGQSNGNMHQKLSSQEPLQTDKTEIKVNGNQNIIKNGVVKGVEISGETDPEDTYANNNTGMITPSKIPLARKT